MSIGNIRLRTAGVQCFTEVGEMSTVSSIQSSSSSGGSLNRSATWTFPARRSVCSGHPPFWKYGSKAGTSANVSPAFDNVCVSACSIKPVSSKSNVN